MKTITTKFEGPTDFLPSRFVATVRDYGGRKKVAVVVINTELNDGERSDQAVLKLAREMKWDGMMVRGHHKEGYVYVFEKDHKLNLNEVTKDD